MAQPVMAQPVITRDMARDAFTRDIMGKDVAPAKQGSPARAKANPKRKAAPTIPKAVGRQRR